MIEKKDGKLTGYLEEAAFMGYIQKLPMASNEEFMCNLVKAQESYASYGITTVQEGFVVSQLAPIFQYLMQAKLLKIDLIGFMDISKADELKENFVIRVNPIYKESLDKQILELKENNLINKDVFILSDESVDKGNALIESLNGKLVIGIDDVIGKIKEELL